MTTNEIYGNKLNLNFEPPRYMYGHLLSNSKDLFRMMKQPSVTLA